MICLEIQEAGAETRLDRAIYSLVDDRTELKAQQIIVAASKMQDKKCFPHMADHVILWL